MIKVVMASGKLCCVFIKDQLHLDQCRLKMKEMRSDKEARQAIKIGY